MSEAGEPVPDARVVFDVFGYNAPARLLDRERLTMNSHYHVEVTDFQGHWHCSHVPSEFGVIRFQVAHPDYAPVTFGSAALGPTTNMNTPYLSEADLRNEVGLITLKRGGIVAGVVVDEVGIPVMGAKVTLGQNWAEPTASQITGADGRFRFANASLQEQFNPNTICFLTVQAEEYGPEDFKFDGSVPPSESRLKISKGVELRGRVVDDNGEPVARATIEICSHSNVRRFEWRTATGLDGRFVWLAAPARDEFYIVQARGYQPMSEVKWSPDGTEHVVILKPNPPPMRIAGSVVDSSTGIPVGNFQVWMSMVEDRYTGYSKPMASARPLHLCATGVAGQFAFTNKDPFTSFELEVRAQGYSPAKRSGLGPLTNDCYFDFQLEPASSLTGEVRLADETPAPSATVMLLTKNAGVYMKLQGQFDLHFSGAKHVQTDAQGRFSFEPTSDAKDVLAFNPTGFASIKPKELMASHVIKLEPWGRVAGQLKIGKHIGAHQMIDLNYMGNLKPSGYSVFLETRTDAEGHFAFEGVPPLLLNVAHRLSFRDGQPGPIPQTQQTAVQVQPGQTSYVTLGGTGYKVTGKIVLNDSNGEADWQSDVQALVTKSPRQPRPP